MEPEKSDKLPGTVVIADFAERRAREPLPEAPALDSEQLAAGTKLGRYVIVEKLGGGGMGVVYKAQDTELHRTAALKVLPPHLCRHPEYLTRFRSEAQAHARLNSPYVITLFSLLELPAGEVLVLEYVEGQTLEQKLRAGGPLKSEEAVRIFDQALRGVEHIHSKGVVHRDLKPANIFITQSGQVKLMDFGIAKIMDQPEQNSQRTMVGTLLYISPEQINGHAIDFRSDVYTLGVSLFETVTGRLPFERRSDYALMHAHVQERPPSPKDFQRRIPPELEWVILKAIEKDPNRRFQTANEFRRTLLKLGIIERRTRGVGKSEAVTDLKSGRQLWRAFGAVMALVACVMGFIYALMQYPANLPGPAPTLAINPSLPSQTESSSGDAKKSSAAQSNAARAKKSQKEKPTKYDSLRDAWGN